MLTITLNLTLTLSLTLTLNLVVNSRVGELAVGELTDKNPN